MTEARPFDELTDEALVERAQAGEDAAMEAALDRYKNFVRARARTYFLVGADREDIIQEGMIGLYKAVRDFIPADEEDNQHSFRAFVELCVTRQMFTAIKSATRQKHQPLNSYISLNRPMFEEDAGGSTLVDVLASGQNSNPEELLISKEEQDDIEERLEERLSPLEKQVLGHYLAGRSYAEISELLGRQAKAVDNALQRIKRKLEKYLEERAGDA